MIFINFKRRWVMLALALAVWCMGCSGSDDSTTSQQGDGFHRTPPADVQARVEDLKKLLPREVYDTITAGSRNNEECWDRNRDILGLPPELNGQWYYTYDNLIKGMAQLEEFANEGDENTKKLEIAAFLANIAQETGAGSMIAFGGPGCFIQEGNGSEVVRKSPNWGGVAPTGAGYCGRGPHQLTWAVNYAAFGVTMEGDDGDKDKYLNDPDLLTTDPETGIAGSIWFWGHEERTDWSPPKIPFKPAAHNVAVGDWTPTNRDTTGVRTSNDVDCGRTKADFGIIINLINGGLECRRKVGDEILEPLKPEEAKNRVNYLKAIAAEMGVTIPDWFLDDCSTQINFADCPSY